MFRGERSGHQSASLFRSQTSAMASKFGKTNSGFATKSEREKFLFIAAAGAALAVMIIFILVTSLKSGGGTVVASKDDPNKIAALNQNSVFLLAPEAEVPAGTKLSEVRFKKVEWPKMQMPEGAFSDAAEVANLFAKVKLAAGIPMQKMNTTTQEQMPQIATIALTPGNRAVSIEVDDTSGLEGHALPGTHVDIVLTYSQSGNLVSNIIVQNARVLSYGGDTTPGSSIVKEKRPTHTSRTMTLDVATQDALKIQTARQMGRLSLIMRAPDDDAASSSTQFTGQDIAQKSGTGKNSQQNICSKGKIKMGGKEYIVGCDGSMSAVE